MTGGFLPFINHRLLASAILENRYFTSLKDGRMDLARFRESQKQFFFAVRFFSRPMAALMARLPDSRGRQGLVHNLADEHGFEEAPHALFDRSRAHDLTFQSFLASCGVGREELQAAQEGAAVRAFNLGLIGACAFETTATAFACLGMIEYAFADISALIGAAVVARGWVSEAELVHYKLHAEIDKRHAADFFEEVDPAWNQGGTARADVAAGIDLGLHLFDRLYRELDVLPAGL